MAFPAGDPQASGGEAAIILRELRNFLADYDRDPRVNAPLILAAAAQLYGAHLASDLHLAQALLRMAEASVEMFEESTQPPRPAA
jgi:hypothetical protein